MPTARTRRSTKGQCRFCLEDDILRNLISPCVCIGSAKYVHNACLMNWYTHQPTKGLICSVCKIEYARKFNMRMENIPTPDMLETIPLQHPLYTVIGNHFMFFGFLYGILPVFIPYKLAAYYIYQGIYHLYYTLEMLNLVRMVQEKNVYLGMWYEECRFILPIVHVCLLLSIGETYWVAGMSADICMLMYFYEHLEILKELNMVRSFVFIDHPVIETDAASAAEAATVQE
jgi:hypothetical protein